MPVLHAFLHFIAVVYSYPFKLWHGYKSCHNDGGFRNSFGPWHYFRTCDHHAPHHLYAVLLGLLIYGLTVLLLAFIAKKIYDEVQWRRNRKHCQHCKEYTLWVSEREYADSKVVQCTSGEACCEDCNYKHYVQELAGKSYICDNDDTPMEVDLVKDQCVHRCPTCGMRKIDAPFYGKLVKRLRRKVYVQRSSDDVALLVFPVMFFAFMMMGIAASHS